MVRLRLRRTGTRNKACFRIVAADQRSPRDGRFIEVIGYYDPRHQDERIDLERADYWLAQGAQATETVTSIITRARTGKTLKKEAPAAKEEPAKTTAKEAPAETPAELDVAAALDEAEAAAEPAESEAEAAETPEAEAPAEAAAEAPAEDADADTETEEAKAE